MSKFLSERAVKGKSLRGVGIMIFVGSASYVGHTECCLFEWGTCGTLRYWGSYYSRINVVFKLNPEINSVIVATLNLKGRKQNW